MGVAARAHHAEEIDQASVVVILGDLFHVLVAQAIRVKFIAADAQAHAEIRADFLAHRLDDFQAEAHAVLETAAPFIGALVDARAPELVDHVLMHGRQFDAVQPTSLGASRCAGVIADHAPDFFRFDGLAGRPVHRLADARWRHQGRPVITIPARASAHVGNLDHDLRAVLVHGVGEVLKMRDNPVGRQIDRLPPALRAVNGHARRAAADRQANTALGFLFVILHVTVSGHAAVGGVHLGVRGAEHTVADCQFADLDRLEHRFESHNAILDLQRLDDKQSVVVTFFGATVNLLGNGPDRAATGGEYLVHRTGEPAGEHVIDLAPDLAVDVHKA
ncbi:hypothetical protein ALQ24_05758 [Pseudomonas syringae pv. antirrhini]|nr:hypothetical protein ALQ24_05758 [Pseudomonas syringae pv. antirrhini]